MLLIGDAAGAVNPFNGEGIAYAIETGEIAAELIHEALVKDRPGIAMMLPARCCASATATTSPSAAGFAKLVGQPAIMGRGHAVPAAEPARSWGSRCG